jgi:hypothetical protein
VGFGSEFCQHGFGGVYALHRNPFFGRWKGDPAGPDPQLQRGSFSGKLSQQLNRSWIVFTIILIVQVSNLVAVG